MASDVDLRTFRDALSRLEEALVDRAADLGLIAECGDWMRHVENRNRTVHAYSEPVADAIAANAAAFAADARALLGAMERGIADGG